MKHEAGLHSDEELLAFLKSTDFFSRVDDQVLTEIIARLTPFTLTEDECLFKQGAPGDALYLVTDGRLRVVITKQIGETITVGEVKTGQLVGEMQILSGKERTASVYAVEKTGLIKISKAVIEDMIQKYPGLVKQMADVIRRRLKRNRLADIFKKLFGPLTEALLKEIEAEIQWVHIAKGELLCKEGEAGDSMYIVVSGHLSAFREDENHNRIILGHIERGESVGEMTIITGAERSSSVIANRDCELVKFTKNSFEAVFTKYPQALLQITRIIIDRFREQLNPTSREDIQKTITIVPISPDVKLDDFTGKLLESFTRYEMAFHISREKMQEMLGIEDINLLSTDDPDYIKAISRLDEEEDKWTYTIYQADNGITNWSELCINRSDLVLVVGDANTDPELTEIERRLLYNNDNESNTPQKLILLHPVGKKQPRGTVKWLSVRDVKTHHHIRPENDEDFNRLARFLCGRAVGLVLSGGGARGFSHLGIIKALKDANIPIDYIGGVSMGSLMSSQYAMELDFDTIIANVFKVTKSVVDLTLPLVSLARGKKLAARYTALFKDLQIEDLWIPYFCVSTNLSTADVKVHRNGPLKTAVLASSSPAPLAPPVIQDGHLLYDGFILNNTPADVMRDIIGRGTVIAVEVVPVVDLEKNDAYGDKGLSGWKIFWSKINPFVRTINLPSIADIMIRANELYSIYHRKEVKLHADLYLRPPIEKFAILNFKPDICRRIMDIGYEYAVHILDVWEEKPSEDELII